MDELRAFADLKRRLLERLSTRVVPFRWGTAYLDAEFPTRYYSNFLLADSDLDAASPEDLIGAADEILGGAGYAHRRVVVRGEPSAARLHSGFAMNGYEAAREVVLIHRRKPDRAGALEVEEVSFDGARALIERAYREDPDLPPEVTAPFTQQHRKFELVIGARFFVAQVNGTQAGHCELFVDGADALVENVGTLERFRNKGVARSIVLRAIEAARKAGAIRTFIMADEEDWPKELYQRLGFAPLGVDVPFTKSSPAPSRATTVPGADASRIRRNRTLGPWGL
ncbi:MAG: GNAT family N-acetyltransferase [Actinobacteria bacterium]|nr:GNAT family N-acetyltransferase [Actinomycetota bacterium]